MIREQIVAKRAFRGYILVSVILIVFSLFFEIKHDSNQVIETSTIIAKASISKDLHYKEWVTSQGGVYVPAEGKTSNSNNILHIVNRDGLLVDSMGYMLLNPSIMIHRVLEKRNKVTFTTGHISSLNPFDPENKADEWETKALKSFENGEEEALEVAQINGEEYLRYMKPLKVEQPSYKHYEKTGYKLGDIVGGISVAVPLRNFKTIAKEKIITSIIAHCSILIFLLLFGRLTYRTLQKSLKNRIDLYHKLKLREEKLVENNFFLRESQKIGKIGSYKLYFKTGYWTNTETLDEIFGIDEDYIRSIEGWIKIIHPEWQSEMQEYFTEEVVKQKKFFDKEYKIVNLKTGKEIWVHGIGKLSFDAEGNLDFMSGTIQDINKRKLSELEIRNQKIIFETMFNTLKDGVVLTNTQREITYANKGMEITFGYKPEELIGEKTEVLYAENIHFEEIAKSINNEDRLQPNELFTTLYKDKNNMIFPGETFGARIYDTQGEWMGNLQIMRNVSKRLELENSIRESEERFRAISEQASEGITLVNNEGKYIFVNHAFCKMTGYSEEELLTMKLIDIVEFVSTKELIIQHGIAQEIVLKRKNSSVFPIQLIVNPIKIGNNELQLGMVSDISYRKILEEEKFKLSKAVEQSANTVVITDIYGNITYVNPKFTELTGYTAEEAIGKNPRILKSGSQPQEFYKKMWETILSGKTWKGELHNKAKSGEFFWERATISPLKNNEGIINGFLAVKEDITKIIELERDIIVTSIETEEKERARIAAELHDGIGPLLSTAKLYINWLLKDGSNVKKDELLKKTEEIISLTNTTIKEISNNLSPSILEHFGLCPAIETFVEPLKLSSSIEFSLQFNLSNRLNIIQEHIIYRIITESINNSIKHSKAQRISLAIYNTDDMFYLTYNDDGVGVDLYTLSQTKYGLGLLSIKKRLDSINAKIEYEPDLQKGMGFKVSLKANFTSSNT